MKKKTCIKGSPFIIPAVKGTRSIEGEFSTEWLKTFTPKVRKGDKHTISGLLGYDPSRVMHVRVTKVRSNKEMGITRVEYEEIEFNYQGHELHSDGECAEILARAILADSKKHYPGRKIVAAAWNTYTVSMIAAVPK